MVRKNPNETRKEQLKARFAEKAKNKGVKVVKGKGLNRKREQKSNRKSGKRSGEGKIGRQIEGQIEGQVVESGTRDWWGGGSDSDSGSANYDPKSGSTN